MILSTVGHAIACFLIVASVGNVVLAVFFRNFPLKALMYQQFITLPLLTLAWFLTTPTLFLVFFAFGVFGGITFDAKRRAMRS